MPAEVNIRDARRLVILQMRGSSPNRVVLRAATRIARTFRGRLSGQFFANEDLLALAKLPFAQEISETGSSMRRLTIDTVQKEMDAASAAVRRLFEQISKSAGFDTSFDILAQESRDAHLAGIIALGEALERTTTRRDRPSMRETFLANPDVAGMLAAGSRATRSRGPVLALLEPGCDVAPIVDTAEQIAKSDRDAVEIVILGNSESETTALADRALAALDKDTQFRLYKFELIDAAALASLVESRRVGLVVAGAGGMLGGDAFVRFACQIDCPLLLMR